jgi:3-dehydroquinate dehydratase/shikimate dehydrogenase
MVCATVGGRTTAELLEERSRVEPLSDLVELRLDGVADLDLDRVLTARPRPAIVTCRPLSEGGRFDGSERERRHILARAVRSSVAYVDLEWQSGLDDLLGERGGRGVVLSFHDFEGVPADLGARVEAMAASGAEVLKIAVHIRELRDLLRLLDLRLRHPQLRVVLIGMGFRGLASRVLASRFGSAWMYAGRERQAGQLDVDTLLEVYRFRSIGRSTAVFGVTGSPLEHSLSPAMHNAGFAAAGLNAVYVPFETEDAADLLSVAGVFGVKGLSVTAPLKIALRKTAKQQDDVSRRVGAVNTMRPYADGWEAINTDVAGFLAPLVDVNLSGIRATVMGAGGAARAVVEALKGRGARVSIAARRATAARAAQPKESICAFPPQAGTWDLLVNATPVGTWPDVEETPVPAGSLAGGRMVYDLVYNPPVTRLLRDAAAAGCRTIGGLEMLVAQAERQFEWWTGRRPERGLFKAAAEAKLTHAAYNV